MAFSKSKATIRSAFGLSVVLAAFLLDHGIPCSYAGELRWRNDTNYNTAVLRYYSYAIESTTNVTYHAVSLSRTTNNIIQQWAGGDDFNGRLMARLFFDVMKLNITNMTVIHTDMLSGWSEWRRVPATSTNAFVALTGKHRFFKLTVVAP